ncbi:MAG: sigma-54 dependent transcriptional regulator [Pseudomonadota bacterium]
MYADGSARFPPLAPILGRSDSIIALNRRLPRVARAGKTTLIIGATGTGKELVARSLHSLSLRRDRPFVTVHCGAIPDTLVESELFGHTRGAFTGAREGRAGLVRAAASGTLFLDEINSLSLAAQARLLRFLDAGEYRPIGSDRCERSDAWVIAATNRDLSEQTQDDGFRRDLLYRLDVVKLRVPTLHERGGDILVLAEHFLAEAGGTGMRFSEPARLAMLRHVWDGNVRELRNRVENAVLMADGDLIEPSDLGLARTRSEPDMEPDHDLSGDLERMLWGLIEREGMTLGGAVQRCERVLLQEALRAEGGNRTRAAKRLGIHVRTIFKKLAD